MTRLVATLMCVRRTGLFVFLLACFTPALLHASSIVPPKDLGELAFMSEAVVLARAGTGTSFGRGGMIFTTTDFEVLETVQGAATGHISVETYGGVVGDTGWQVAGSPSFEPGAVYLLFLNRQGTAWQPRMMAYGLLERVVADDGSVMLTHIAEHHELNLVARFDGVRTEPVETYYEQPLLNHLRAVTASRMAWSREASVVPEAAQPISHETGASKSMMIPEPCEYLNHSGFPIRWSSFDEGLSVNIFANEEGDNDLFDGSDSTSVQTSIDLWTSISSIALDYQWAGTAPYTPDCMDGSATPNNIAINQGLIQYNDPCAEIPDLTACSGTLAFGGSFFRINAEGRHGHQGMEWNTSVVAFIIINNGVGPCLDSTQYRIMMTHEMGHTLGFGHISSAAGEAIMNPSCCNDITPIDEMCALFAYPNLGTVTLNMPVNSATNQPTMLTLDWQPVSNADAYQVQLAEAETFANPLVDEGNLTQTELNISGLEEETEYFWRVRAINSTATGPWSEVYRFTTVFPAPGLVTLRAPVDDTVNQPINVTFAWNEGASALTYHLQVATDDAFAQVVFDDTSLMATEHDLTLEHSTTYFWRVRAINPVGQGDWSPPWSVTTLPPRPAAVVLGTPQDHALDQPFTLTLTWTPDAEATTHHLQVGIDSDFSAIFFEDTDLTATEQEIASLDDGVVYYWRVRGHNAAGFGPWSPVFQFTTAAAPGTLALTFPEDDAVDATSTITFAWEADRAADVYQIQVSRLPNFGQVAFQDFSLTEPMRTFGPLAYSARHYWRVRALNEIGTGPWSEVRAFRVAVGTAVERVDETIPTAYELHANYPNPFNPTTTLRFDLPASSEVTLVIYDMLGREVETLVAGTLAAGRYSFAWEATARPSGLYLARLRAGRFTQSRQMLLLK